MNNIDSLMKSKCTAKTAEDFCDIYEVDRALQVCVAVKIETTMTKILASKASKKEITNNLYALDIVSMAQGHIKYVTFNIFKSKLGQFQDVNLRKHMINLCVLCGLCFLQDMKTNGYDTGYFKKGDNSLIEGAICILLKKLRPQAIPLIESAIQLPDEILCSSVGNSYGDIYETAFEWAKTSRYNKPNGNIPEGWKEYMSPIINAKAKL